MINNIQSLIILASPNVSEQLGGEAMKALQIFQQYRKLQPNTIQITHVRNKAELKDRLQLDNVFFIEDDLIFVFLWKSIIFRLLIDVWFSKKAIQLAEKIALEKNIPKEQVIIHQTEPNSPVMPRTISKHHKNVFGPINGNIYYPKIFRHIESKLVKFRRILHFPLQRLNALMLNGLKKADLIFVAGGDRTKQSLTAAGCTKEQMVDTIDCGINCHFLKRDRIQHSSVNYRFIHYGRMVLHKGTFLLIKSLKKTKQPINVDIVGHGPELAACKKLVDELDLTSRIRFLDWHTNHNDLLDSLCNYRGVVLPSLEDANGMVIQEAMAVGLPPICLNWGGPQLLIDHNKDGFLVDPSSEEAITSTLAKYMDTLANDGDLAESFSLSCREKASNWRWSTTCQTWIKHYELINKPTQYSEAIST